MTLKFTPDGKVDRRAMGMDDAARFGFVGSQTYDLADALDECVAALHDQHRHQVLRGNVAMAAWIEKSLRKIGAIEP